MSKKATADEWVVELSGRRVAILTDPQFYDMFWESFEIEPVVSDFAEQWRMLTDRTWWLENRFVFRNHLTKQVAENAFPAGDVFTDSGRVIMRGLYIV